LINCDEETYAFHANAQKNDFAEWVNNVLLFPELSESLKISKGIAEARDALMEFFQVFDYRSKSITEDRVFYTVDDYKLKNVQELYYYTNNCDDGSFQYHFNAQKNDFANWTSDVLLFPALSAKMRIVKDRQGLITVLKEFLLTSKEYGMNPEYERYINERLVHEDKKELNENANTSGNVDAGSVHVDKNTSTTQTTTQTISSDLASDVSSNIYALNSGTKTNKVAEETINMDKKFEYVRAEDPEKTSETALDKKGFRQFTDEELEKFVDFSRTEKTNDADLKVEYLKTVLMELKNMVRDLRRAEKDPFVADLMLRTLDSKIGYYALSKNVEDYNHIIRLMKDVQKEIEDTAEQHSYNIAEEILTDLRLQGIAMKKA
jgi:hypothetical protein